MSTMVERVARAIGVADLNASAKSMPNVPMETMAEYVKHVADEGHYEAMARAAIEAMMEPSTDMLKAADLVVLTDEEIHRGPFELSKAEWRSMIQAALKEQA